MRPAPNRSRRGAVPVLMRGLLVLGFLLAVGAVAVAVLSDDVRLLKLAALLGVWAALATAFPVVYFRRSARMAEQKTEESKRTYELELHREISARREYEIGVSEAAREDAETRHREELAGLREQLDRLNTTLSGLLDGDLLFERLTLSAESTRVRQVGGGESGRGRLTAMARPGQIEYAQAPTGPYVGQRSGVPTADGRGFGAAGARHPVREDDTVQFPRATFGPGAHPAPGAPVEPAVVEAPMTGDENTHAGPARPSAPFNRPDSPQLNTEPEPVAHHVEPEPIVHEREPVEPAAPEPVADEVATGSAVDEPEPAQAAEPEPEPAPESEPEPEPESGPAPELEPSSESEEPTPVIEGNETESAVDGPASAGEAEEAGPSAEPAVPGELGVHDLVPTFSDPATAPADPLEHPGTGHSAGISVADLLAAYGGGEGAPRRRRRAED